MKKIISLIFIFVLVLNFSACSSDDTTKNGTDETTETTETTETLDGALSKDEYSERLDAEFAEFSSALDDFLVTYSDIFYRREGTGQILVYEEFYEGTDEDGLYPKAEEELRTIYIEYSKALSEFYIDGSEESKEVADNFAALSDLGQQSLDRAKEIDGLTLSFSQKSDEELVALRDESVELATLNNDLIYSLLKQNLISVEDLEKFRFVFYEY